MKEVLKRPEQIPPRMTRPLSPILGTPMIFTGSSILIRTMNHKYLAVMRWKSTPFETTSGQSAVLAAGSLTNR